MRRTALAISALLAAAGLGALAAVGLAGAGDGSQVVIAPDREFESVPVEPAGDSAGAALGRRAMRARKQNLVFFDTVRPLEVAPQTEEAATLECPKGYRALGAYYISGRPGVLLDLTAPHAAWIKATATDSGAKPSKRKWVVGVFNATEETDHADLGVACLNRLK